MLVVICPVTEKYLALNQGSEYSPGDWICLLSPNVNVNKPKCIRFYYYSWYVDLTVSRYWEGGRQEVSARLPYDGSLKRWRWAEVTLEPVQYGLVFNFTILESNAGNDAGIGNITLSSGQCSTDGNIVYLS